MDANLADFAEDRHTVTLRALAGMSLELCRDLQQRAIEAESAEDAVHLSAAFHRVARGLRQTLALELKVVRYNDELAEKAAAKTDLAEAKQKAAADLHETAVDQLREAVRDRVGDCFWSEHEDPDWRTTEDGREKPDRPPVDDPMWQKLDAFLDEAEAQPDFLTRDFDLLVIEACDAIGADPTLLYEIRGRPVPAPETADSS